MIPILKPTTLIQKKQKNASRQTQDLSATEIHCIALSLPISYMRNEKDILKVIEVLNTF